MVKRYHKTSETIQIETVSLFAPPHAKMDGHGLHPTPVSFLILWVNTKIISHTPQVQTSVTSAQSKLDEWTLKYNAGSPSARGVRFRGHGSRKRSEESESARRGWRELAVEQLSSILQRMR